MHLPIRVGQFAVAGQEPVGGRVLVRVEIARGDDRGFFERLGEPLPQEMGGPVNGGGLAVKMGVDKGDGPACRLMEKPGPRYSARKDAAPASAAGDLRGVAEPEDALPDDAEGGLPEEEAGAISSAVPPSPSRCTP